MGRAKYSEGQLTTTKAGASAMSGASFTAFTGNTGIMRHNLLVVNNGSPIGQVSWDNGTTWHGFLGSNSTFFPNIDLEVGPVKCQRVGTSSGANLADVFISAW